MNSDGKLYSEFKNLSCNHQKCISKRYSKANDDVHQYSILGTCSDTGPITNFLPRPIGRLDQCPGGLKHFCRDDDITKLDPFFCKQKVEIVCGRFFNDDTRNKVIIKKFSP
jgi:hypothetical protein